MACVHIRPSQAPEKFHSQSSRTKCGTDLVVLRGVEVGVSSSLPPVGCTEWEQLHIYGQLRKREGCDTPVLYHTVLYYRHVVNMDSHCYGVFDN